MHKKITIFTTHSKIITLILASVALNHSTLTKASFIDETAQTNENPTEVIVVEGRRKQAYTEVTPETEKLLRIAGLDHDPLSAVFSMPGIVYTGGDDGLEPAIRGSSTDDNAFYIDDLPSSYIFHLFGDSIFNENVVRDFSLSPAAFGSTYGNATGGVFDVKLRDPRNQELTTTIDMSLLKASAMVEGGINEDHAFYLAYRRSLIHLFSLKELKTRVTLFFKPPLATTTKVNTNGYYVTNTSSPLPSQVLVILAVSIFLMHLKLAVPIQALLVI